MPTSYSMKDTLLTAGTAEVGRQMTDALSFYKSKMILDRPNCFGLVQIILVGSKLFWSGLNLIFLD